MRRNLDQVPPAEKKLVLSALHNAASSFTDKKAVVSFIDEVLTDGERIVIGRRIAIAQMILSGHTYYEIRKKLRISPNTFTKVNKWLSEQLPGYAESLKLNKEAAAKSADKHKRNTHDHTVPFSFGYMKKRYPAHFLLFNIIDEFLKE